MPVKINAGIARCTLRCSPQARGSDDKCSKERERVGRVKSRVCGVL
ncbi:MAG: hypothetical protein N2V74_06800 [Candidatus Methanospirare jalkutatii]|nr:MAG: hypothetical protein N2V74_06800 [Candidatus Methanospirare jalkutatii]